ELGADLDPGRAVVPLVRPCAERPGLDGKVRRGFVTGQEGGARGALVGGGVLHAIHVCVGDRVVHPATVWRQYRPANTRETSNAGWSENDRMPRPAHGGSGRLPGWDAVACVLSLQALGLRDGW